MTAIEGEATKPRQEFLIAVVGPITSIAVGVARSDCGSSPPDGLLRMAVEGLAGANLLVGALNLVPGLPLDGGRVLKSAVWAITGNVHRGTIVAGWGGRLTAVAVLSWPMLQLPLLGVEPDLLDFILAFVIALFLWSGSTAAMSSARLRRRLPASSHETSPVVRSPSRTSYPSAEAVRRAQEAHAGSIVTVTSDGRPLGVVNEAALLATPEERRPWVAVSTVARTLEAGLSLPATITGEDLILAISRRPAPEYLLVEDDGSIYGVLSTADLDEAFREPRR